MQLTRSLGEAMNTITFWNESKLERVPDISSHYINHFRQNKYNHLEDLRKYLKSFGPLPKKTSFLGTCQDGLPLFVDLGDSSPGSILLVADDPYRNLQLLRNFLAAAMIINSEQILRCNIISPNIGNFSDLHTAGHIESMISIYESQAHQLIYNLAVLAEQRRTGRMLGETQLLLIDDISELLKYEDFETNNHLKWIVENGPINSVWVIASIDRAKIDQYDKSILKHFGTYILSQQFSNRSALLSPGNTNLMDSYTTRIGSETIHFYLPVQV